jgi:hypothetical protein
MITLIYSVVLSVVQVTDGQFVASSPDERAIMEACFHHGLVYNGELADGRLSVTVQGIGTLLLILCTEAKGRFSPCFLGTFLRTLKSRSKTYFLQGDTELFQI